MLQFAISSSPMIHLVPHPPPPPLKIWKKWLSFPLSQEKVRTMLMQFFWENKVYYGRCANGESQFERKWFFLWWLYKGFQRQHLPRLSINFVVINKDLEKLQTQLYYIKVWFCDDQVYNDIRVVLSTKWRHNLFYLQSYFSALYAQTWKVLTLKTPWSHLKHQSSNTIIL